MSAIHIYRADIQPMAPRYWDSNLPPDGGWVSVNPRRVIRCHDCRDWRWAKYLTIQVYYDQVRIKCADGCYGENRTHRKVKV